MSDLQLCDKCGQSGEHGDDMTPCVTCARTCCDSCRNEDGECFGCVDADESTRCAECGGPLYAGDCLNCDPNTKEEHGT